MIRRLENSGHLRPIISAAGVRFYGDEVVERVSRRRTLRAERDGGVLAAQVFAALDAGASAKDIVFRHCIEPRRVETLQLEHARLQRSIVVSGRDVDELEALLGTVCAAGADLVNAARRLVSVVQRHEADARRYEAREAQWQQAFQVVRMFGYHSPPPPPAHEER